jgi:hypothetical protein
MRTYCSPIIETQLNLRLFKRVTSKNQLQSIIEARFTNLYFVVSNRNLYLRVEH